jgi:serine/threonine-protein phosphatase 5
VHAGGEFKKECLEKYNEEVLTAFLDSFEFLPLATVIGHQYFVVHGGPLVEKDFTLADIQVLQRPSDESDLRMQLLWNDPVIPEENSKTPHGGGKLFLPGVVDAFLTNEGLLMVIRSHEFTAKLTEGHNRWQMPHS